MSESTKPTPVSTEVETPAAETPEEKTPSVSFAEAAQEEQPGLVREFVDFLIESKAWWLTPIIVVLLLVGVLVFLTGTAAAPFIYTIF